MNADEDLSVQLAATFELCRSLCNPPKNKLDHNLVAVTMPMATKSKGKLTLRKVLLLQVNVQIFFFQDCNANSMLFRMTLRMKGLSSQMLGRQWFVFKILNAILK